MSKFNDVKSKRGVDLAEHLVAYYQAQEDYFQDGNLIMKALKAWEGRFTTQCSEVCVCVCVVQPCTDGVVVMSVPSLCCSNEPSRTMRRSC